MTNYISTCFFLGYKFIYFFLLLSCSIRDIFQSKFQIYINNKIEIFVACKHKIMCVLFSILKDLFLSHPITIYHYQIKGNVTRNVLMNEKRIQFTLLRSFVKVCRLKMLTKLYIFIERKFSNHLLFCTDMKTWKLHLKQETTIRLKVFEIFRYKRNR